jgi:hypothetical protein
MFLKTAEKKKKKTLHKTLRIHVVLREGADSEQNPSQL